MKNLKQVLALGMAFSLTMSTMASAAFTDQDSINKANTEAVDLLTNLSIIQGYEDGSFRPEGTVTRAEMAKMIYTIRNGGNDDASAYESVDTSFTDIKGHWAEGYIKYLQNTGIVAGKSATKFDPDAPVTTAEAMKMALVLGGYRSDKANLTGAEWFNNTVSWATTNQLTDDVMSSMNGPCTRASAAQILANALEMTAVQWSEFVNAFVNDSKSGLAMGSDPITVGNKWMDLTVYVGKMTAAGELDIDSSDGVNAGKDRFVVEVETVDNVDVNKIITIADPTMRFKDGIDHTGLVGQEVKVLTGEKVDNVYGVYATGTSQVAETTMDKVEYVKNSGGKVKVDGVTYDTVNAKVFVDLKSTPTNINDANVIGASGKAVSDKVKLIDADNDGKYETVLVNTAYVAELTYVGTESVTLGQVGARVRNNDSGYVAGEDIKDNTVIEKTDMTIYEGAAKGDYVVLTKNLYSDTWNIEKATVVTGTVDGVVNNERKVRVNGTWYTLANTKQDTEIDPNTGKVDGKFDLRSIPNSIETFANKDNVTLYVVGDIAYYAESTKGNDVNRPVAMVYDMKATGGNWNTTPQAKIILPDGTKKTVDIASDSTVKVGSLNRGQMYNYVVNNDGEYKFTALSGTTVTAGYDKYVTDTDGIYSDDLYGGAGSSGYTIADDAIVFAFVQNGTSYDAKIYTGKAVKDAKKNNGWGASATGGALIQENNGFTYTRMMSVQLNNSQLINSNTNYGYLVTDGTYSYNSELGSWVMEYSYWNGTEVVNVMEKTSANKEQWAVKGTVINFTNDGEGFIKDVTEPEEATIAADKLHYASMKGADNSYVSLVSATAGVVNAKVTSDTVIYYVDSNASSFDKIGQAGSGYNYTIQKLSDGSRPVNVAYVLNSNGDVKFMVIDVDGQLNGHNNITEIEKSNATGAEITAALSNGDVYVYGNVAASASITVPAGKTLVIDGNAAGDITLDGAGEVIIKGTVAGKLETAAGSTVNVTVEGATLVRAVGDAVVTLTTNGTGSVSVNGQVSTINVASAANVAVTGNVTDVNVTVAGASLSVTGNVTGTVDINKNINLAVTGDVGTVDIDAAVTGGTVSIDGDVTTLTNNGSVNPVITGGVTTNNGSNTTYSNGKDTKATKVSL